MYTIPGGPSIIVGQFDKAGFEFSIIKTTTDKGVVYTVMRVEQMSGETHYPQQFTQDQTDALIRWFSMACHNEK